MTSSSGGKCCHIARSLIAALPALYVAQTGVLPVAAPGVYEGPSNLLGCSKVWQSRFKLTFERKDTLTLKWRLHASKLTDRSPILPMGAKCTCTQGETVTVPRLVTKPVKTSWRASSSALPKALRQCFALLQQDVFPPHTGYREGCPSDEPEVVLVA